jgi:low affinity Fe/Cu permease
MPDDKSKIGQPDRSRVATDQDYEVSQLAQKHGLTQQQALDLIARVGNDREKLDRAAKELSGDRQTAMSKLFTRFAGWWAWAFGHPLAFILACLATLAWAVTGPVFNYSDTWQLVINTGTTVATFLMIFVLQHSQNRDSTAIQAKLDELIVASEGSNKLVRAEQLTEEEVEDLRCNPIPEVRDGGAFAERRPASQHPTSQGA